MSASLCGIHVEHHQAVGHHFQALLLVGRLGHGKCTRHCHSNCADCKRDKKRFLGEVEAISFSSSFQGVRLGL